ncbi:hypothetical protein EUX98_g1806 [Antrodiella citrinella]|uniref:ATP-dependent DNA ligase family profile domain-containing protein n=1 Tax=Antrodiella citrinella TaxID=2447956 RepID=A0A4S4N0H9_9APHY|nr:hypothetical protein EUX98_g1806 [Antrodiella citrinella]
MDIPTPGYVTFQFFASLLHNISSIPRKGKAKTRSNAIDPVHKVFQDWVNQLRRDYPNAASGTTSIVFRLLFPEEDVSRRYGLQEITLARHLAENLDTLHTLQDVDMLLTELATTSPFSSASVRSAAPKPRSKRAILTELFRSLDDTEAAFMTQIILKDLRPIVYPIEETHYSTSLLLYNTNAINMLTKEEAMKIWDPSFKMLRAYSVRATLEAAAEIYEDPNAELTPRLGVPIGIPKCTKGLGCSNAIKALRRSNTIWAETKYDGERAQIHVQIDENMDSQITIFSKSKRDSTLDRHGVHHIIREALGLPQRHEKRPPSEDHEFWVMKNVVLEAEMVAYSDTLAKVDGGHLQLCNCAN